MWRQISTSDTRDSDEIISDEDELDPVCYDYDCSKNLKTLIPQSKVHLPAVPHTNSLKEKNNFINGGPQDLNFSQTNYSTSLGKLEEFYSEQKIVDHGLEDEDLDLIQSLCDDDVHHIKSGDESISEEEIDAVSKESNNFASAKSNNYCGSEHDNQRTQTWAAAIDEANALACAHKELNKCIRIHDTSQTKYVKKGSKAKLKFSFRSLLHKEGSSYSPLKYVNEKSSANVPEGHASHNQLEEATTTNAMVKLLENWQKEALHPKAFGRENTRAVSSMAELLENMQQTSSPSKKHPNKMLEDAKEKDTKTQILGKRGLSHLGSRILDDEDPPEFEDGGVSSEDEVIQHKQLCIIKDKGKTMADIFEEAFGRSEEDGLRFPTGLHSGSGYHGRLQQILQIEKDKHLELMKDSQPGQNRTSHSKSMDVRILSRYLEGKLTVCQCVYKENTNGSQSGRSGQKCEYDERTVKITVIFNPKICDDVELEVGDLVRILPPWKEILPSHDERIVLCTYFSQI